MFDLITGAIDRPLQERSAKSTIVSIVGHIAVITTLLAVSLWTVGPPALARRVTEVFVAAELPAPVMPPPAPQPAPAPAPSRKAPAASPPPASAPAVAAPLEAPAAVTPEPAVEPPVEHGVPGGIGEGPAEARAGEVAGQEVFAAPPPPPPPPEPAAPVRVGGQVKIPALITKVAAEYPPLAQSAHIGGAVVLEATVGTDGCVQSVRVMSGNALLTGAAVSAVKQWRYSVLLLNGIPTPFVITVTLNFHLK